MSPKLLIILVLAGSASATDCTGAETCQDSQALLQARTSIEKFSAEEEGAGLETAMVEADDLEALIALGHSIGAVRTSMDASKQLSVVFRHEGQEHSYKLTPHSVYTQDAAIYEDGVLLGLGADSQTSTFRTRADGKGASVTLLGNKKVRGLFEHEGKVMEITPLSDDDDDDIATAFLESSNYESKVQPAHLIRWVAAPQLGAVGAQLGFSLSATQRARDDEGDKGGEGDQKPSIEDGGGIGAHIPQDKAGIGPTDPDSGWNGVRWWPGCYTGDSEMHEFIITIATDKAAKDKMEKPSKYAANPRPGNLKTTIEYTVNEASWVFERQMHIRLKIGRLDMDTTGSDYGGCPAEGKEMSDKLDRISNVVSSGKLPAGGASHIFTGCGKRSGLAGLAYLGKICEKRWAVGSNKIHTWSPWLVFAHELGHNFNAKHSFEDGKTKTGGIMDYGDGKLNGEYQFNGYRKTQMCKKIESKVNKCDGKFQKDPTPPTTPAPVPSGPWDPNAPGAWGPFAVEPPTPPPTPKPPPLPPGPLPYCKGDRKTWDAGRGECGTYTKEVGSQPWCNVDKQTEVPKDRRGFDAGIAENNGLFASDACSECGRCRDKVHKVEGGPHVCAWKRGKGCRCNGDVYIGPKYVSGNKGALNTFAQMKSGKGVKGHSRDQGFKWAHVTSNGRTEVRCFAHSCPGVASFGVLSGLAPGTNIWCWCVPSGPPPTTTAEPTAPPPPPFAPPPPGGGGFGGGGGWR